jgi:hypothetical protein
LKIEQKLYITSGSPPPPPKEKFLVCACARVFWLTLRKPPTLLLASWGGRAVAMLVPSPSRTTCQQIVTLLLAAFLSRRHCQDCKCSVARLELFSSRPRHRKFIYEGRLISNAHSEISRKRDHVFKQTKVGNKVQYFSYKLKYLFFDIVALSFNTFFPT